MQPAARRRPWLRLVLLAALLLLIVVGVYGGVLANQAGLLPWQEEPVRISTGITPFADIPGFDEPTATPAPGS